MFALTAKRTKILVAVLLALHGAILVDTALRTSETFDEPMYLLASRSYWDGFDFSFNREHPPLTKLLIGLPLKLAGLKVSKSFHTDAATQLRFMYEINDDPRRTLLLGRLPMIALALVLGFYVFLFGRLFGQSAPPREGYDPAPDRAGLLSLLVYTCLPGLTGNAPLAALDFGAAAFGFIALYHLARARQQPASGRTIVAGITFGLAQLTKLSSLLMAPVYGLLALVDAVNRRSVRPLLRLVAVFAVGLTTMFLGYGCEMRTVDSVKGHPRYDDDPQARARGEVFTDPLVGKVARAFGDKPVPMLTYLKAYDYLKRESGEEGHASYFRGETVKKGDKEKDQGWPSFYVVTMAVKTPVFILCLLAFAILVWPWLPKPRGLDGPLLLYPLLIFLFFSFGKTQLGIRYILPVLPAAAVLIGRLAVLDFARARRACAAAAALAFVALPVALFFAFPERGPATLATWLAVVLPALAGVALIALLLARVTDIMVKRLARAFVVGCALLGAAECAWRHPNHLMFFNPFAGGPDRGWRIVSVGDDWGQGASALAKLQREREWGEIAYDYYGTGVPEVYGLKYRPFNGERTTGLVAAHAIQLTRERWREGNPRYAFLDGLEPVARADAILVFEVPPDR